MAGTKKQAEPYNFDPAVERAAVLLCCSDPRFLASTGYAIEPEALGGGPAAQMALRAAKELAQEVGSGPPSPTFVLQHLRRMMNDGKATLEQVGAVEQYLSECEDGFPPLDPAYVTATIAPILQRRGVAEALKQGFDAYANRADVGKVVDLVRKAESIGKHDTSLGLALSADSLSVSSTRDLLTTGIDEVDRIMGGGSVRGELGIVALRTGGGKSLTLGHFASQGIWQGKHVAVATTELDEVMWRDRVVANLTGIPIDHVRVGAPGHARAVAAMRQHEARFGPCTIKYFTAGASTVADLRAWLVQLAEHRARPVDMLVVDSADDLTINTKKELSGHDRVKGVTTQLRALVHDDLKIWGWTASQPKAASSTSRQRKRIDTDDLADGMGKARVCDKLLVAEVAEDQQTITFWLPKNRSGKARQQTPPIPCDFACGAVGPIVRFAPGGATQIP